MKNYQEEGPVFQNGLIGPPQGLVPLMYNDWGGLMRGHCLMSVDCDKRCGACDLALDDLREIGELMDYLGFVRPNLPPFLRREDCGLGLYYGNYNVGILRVRGGKTMAGVFNGPNNAYQYIQGEGGAKIQPLYGWAQRKDLMTFYEILTVAEMLTREGKIPPYFGAREKRWRVGWAEWPKQNGKT